MVGNPAKTPFVVFFLREQAQFWASRHLDATRRGVGMWTSPKPIG